MKCLNSEEKIKPFLNKLQKGKLTKNLIDHYHNETKVTSNLSLNFKVHSLKQLQVDKVFRLGADKPHLGRKNSLLQKVQSNELDLQLIDITKYKPEKCFCVALFYCIGLYKTNLTKYY